MGADASLGEGSRKVGGSLLAQVREQVGCVQPCEGLGVWGGPGVCRLSVSGRWRGGSGGL